MSSLILNTLLVDYASATFFNDTSPELFAKLTEQLEHFTPDAKMREHVPRLQYTGWLRSSQTGSIYLGTGTQVGRPHSLLQVSGALSSNVWDGVLKDLVLGGTLKLTRLDLQVTIPKPDDLDLRGYYNVASTLHRTTSLVTSTNAAGIELSTLYIGARVSDTFWRIYEKVDALGNVVTRAEVELKGDVARQLHRYIREGGALENVYKQKLKKLQLPALAHHFAESMRSGARYIVIRAEAQTGKWLRDTVLPSLTEYLQLAEDADEVAIRFGEVLARYWEYRIQT